MGVDEIGNEIFFMSLKYTKLSSGQSDVEELQGFLNGECIEHSQGLYWSWDRELYAEDIPNCYAEAIETGMRIRASDAKSLLPGTGEYNPQTDIRYFEEHCAPHPYHSAFVSLVPRVDS